MWTEEEQLCAWLCCHIWKVAEKRGTERGAWEEMAKEVEEKQSVMPQKSILVLLERANIRGNHKKLPFSFFFIL